MFEFIETLVTFVYVLVFVLIGLELFKAMKG